jgi:hypothetical protein
MTEAIFYLKTLKKLNARALGAVALCAILFCGTLPVAGCSGVSVAQDIVNWTPTLQSAVASVDATASVLDPAGAPIFTGATAGFDAASTILAAQAKAYLANPNANALTQLQTAVATFQQQVNAALLAAAGIADPASQQKALADIGAVGTIVSTILALVASISTKAQVTAMATASTVKLSQVDRYMDRSRAARILASHYGDSTGREQARVLVARADLGRAGF